MYYELIVDEWFLRNLFLDYFLLRLVNRILGCSATRARSLLGGLLGAAAGCGVLVCLPYLSRGCMLLVTVAVNTLMVRFGCRTRGFWALVKGVLCLLGLSFLLEGIMQTMQFYLGTAGMRTFWQLSLVGAMLLTAALGLYLRRCKKRADICEVTLWVNGKCEKAKGLYDTGNGLWDPLWNKPVTLIDRKLAERIFPEETIKTLQNWGCMEGEHQPVDMGELRPHYIPYRCVGKEKGLLLAVTFSGMLLENENDSREIKSPVIALAWENSSFSGNYQVILSPNLIDN